MKKKIIDALKAKFVGVSESALDRVAGSLAKKVNSEDEIATLIEGVTFAQVLEAYGDSRSTEAAATAIANYEKKYSLSEGKPAQGVPPAKKDAKDGDDGNDTPAWAKALMEQNDRLQKEVDAMRTGKMAESRRAKLDEVLKDLTPAQRKGYSRVNVSEGDDAAFAAVLDEIKGEVAELMSENKATGSSFSAPFAPNGSGKGDGKTKPAADDAVKGVVDMFD